MDLTTNVITVPDIFHGADNINPVYDHEGNVFLLVTEMVSEIFITTIFKLEMLPKNRNSYRNQRYW